MITYCNGTWPSTGGVARYDLQLSLIFPNRKFFRGPQQKNDLLVFLKTCKNPIVITDNHLACDIPNDFPVILVHHGCALTTAQRNPGWDPYWRDLCCNGQKEMLIYRKPSNTWIISISKACTFDFNYYFADSYPTFKRFDILHPSELDEGKYKCDFNQKPVILGNWNHLKKGKHLIDTLKHKLPEFEFIQLNIQPFENETYENFNKRKQNIYLNSDIFLQLANSEGFSYATQDAMICGLVVVSTNVGAYFGDVDKEAYIELDWKKCYTEIDYDYICDQIKLAWKKKEILSTNSRKWYLENCRFVDWEKKMKDIVNKFHNIMYKRDC